MSQPVPFGKYYLLERINVGGMAEVFKAKAFGVEGFERLLALKRILPNIAEDEEFITMFIDEAKIAVQLQHANIAQIFDLGKVDDSFFIALEYVHGKDLRAIFDHFRKTGERMPAAQVCYVMMQVCEGLDYAHNKRDSQGRELGLVHRDVSPQNVLVGYEGEIKLIDFGIAKAAGKASKTQAGILKGKFGYMSPEQVRGLPVDRRSDVFAAGICLYEMLTGERLFIGESDFSTLEKVRNVEILPPSSFNKKIAPELERIVLKALAKDAEDRYQNAIDLHDDLQAYLYSTGEFFSRQDLASWMRKIFANEIADESARNAQWEQLEQPTPVPFMGESRRSGGSGAAARAHGLDWDDEELETQIFDRIPGTGPDSDEDEAELEDDRSSELSSSDIMLTDVGSIVNQHDDKTAIAPPPDEAQLAYDPMSPGNAPMGYGQNMPTPGMTNSPYGQNLLGGPAPLPPGPPPGLSAYRQTSPMPLGGPSSQWIPSTPSQPIQNGGPYPAAGSPFRQTIMGLPQVAAPAYQPPPPPQPQPKQPVYTEASPSQVGQRRRFPILGTLLVMGLALGVMVLYTFMNRPGRLEIDVSPSGASVSLDGVTLKGIPPFRMEKPPGTFKIEAVQDGYTKEERRAEVKPGDVARVKIDLRPSPNTGFELTSDPPGQLVWMDGVPFTGMDPNGPQARTDFKATRVTPGRHLLEIKGDPRFRPWRHEFYQEPGRVLQIRATLYPETGHGPTGRPGSETPRPPAEPPRPAPTPPAATTATETPRPATTPTPPAARPTPPTPAPAPVAATTPPATTPRPAPTAPPRPAPVRPATAPATSTGGETTAAETPTATARPAGTCTISIGARPWAEVWIDGRNTQKVTPLVDFKLPCGRHRVTVKNPELGIEKSEQLTVRAGEKAKKIFQLIDDE
ncbi:MAG TPA: serine/threonine-protein kinase [Polyangia bacterium]